MKAINKWKKHNNLLQRIAKKTGPAEEYIVQEIAGKMKAKAIKDLNQLSDSDLVVQVSKGLDLIFEHIQSIEGDVRFLAEQKNFVDSIYWNQH